MLKSLLKYEKDDSLVRDGVILFSATMVANVFAYLYHFAAGRLLGPAEYGVLGAVISLLYLINVPVNVIQTTIAKFSAQFRAEGKEEKVNRLLGRSLRKMVIVGVGGFLAFFLVHAPLASFLKIPKTALLVFMPIVFFALLLPVMRGVLQGLQRFKELGWNVALEGLLKVGAGLGLIVLGFGVNGAILGIVISFAGASLLVAYFPLRALLKKQGEAFEKAEIYKYAFPVFYVLVILTGYYTIDVLLVKHFFSAAEAGYYAALSIIGKVIFFGTFALGSVMFPKVAEMHSLKKENKHLLKKSLILMVLGSIVDVGVYFAVPKLIVLVLFGEQYLPIVPLVGAMGIAMAFFSLCYLLSLYNLSVNRTKFVYVLGVFFVIEALLIGVFHETLGQVVKILAGTMVGLFLVLYWYTRRGWS